METFTIGIIAKQAGVGIETIRFYERKGLIDNPPRRLSGYRQYPEETIDRLRFIRKAKELGFTLNEISELLELSTDASAKCSDVKDRAKAKIQDIGQKIQALSKMKNALSAITSYCDGQGSICTCPIIDALAKESEQ